jgi:hypothetical protein
MTAEMNKMMNDPNFVVQFAVGDPFPALVPQDPNAGIRFAGMYFREPKRYVLKKAHMSTDDNRMFEHATGRLVFNSHHPGKVRQSVVSCHPSARSLICSRDICP